jgi:tetrachlorobenzoquinone reductase
MSTVMQLRTTSVTWETEAIRTIELRSLVGDLLPPFQAGSHLDIHVPTGLVRSYSLINPQSERHRYLIGVAREKASRGGSVYLCEQLRAGDILDVNEPHNHFRLHEAAPAAVLIGGGIGITPLICMAARLTELGRHWTLHYAVRTRSAAAFLPNLQRYGERLILHCDDEQGGVLDLKRVVASAMPQTHFYCCGPKPMMVAFGELTPAVERERVHVEHFSPLDVAAVEGGFLVELAKSGRTIAVPQGSTILETLRNAGFDLPSSCQQGVCGTCETRVLSGIPDHRDSVLSAVERGANKTMMICCSGARSERLVLDI